MARFQSVAEQPVVLAARRRKRENDLHGFEIGFAMVEEGDFLFCMVVGCWR